MTTASFRIDARRFVLDTLTGLGLFSAMLAAILAGTSPAGAFDATVLSLAETRWLPMALIAAMFSLFMAFNLALYRHVNRVYVAEASRRRRSGHGPRA